MSEITWTFDTITSVTTAYTVQSLGGLYYQGNPGCGIEKQHAEGTFSDGSQWSCNQVFYMQGHPFDPTYLDGERRWAGKYNNLAKRNLSFNTTVSGTCFVVIKSASTTTKTNTASLHCQYKGLNSGYTYNSETMQVADELMELKLHCEAAGSFWLNTTQDSYIYAVRFVPDETMELNKARVSPQVFTKLESGSWYADFGRHAFGQIELTLTSENDNDTVTIHIGECVKNGEVDREPGGYRRYRAIRLPLNKGTHTYLPEIPADARNTKDRAIHMPMEIGEVMPFRYCEIEGYDYPLTSEDVRQIAVHYRFDDDASYFTSDNGILNQVWELCKYTIKATTFPGYYIDGDRERIPYEADTYINHLGHYACDTEFSLGRRTLDRLLRIPNGYSEWIMQSILIAWNDYMYSGDTELIAKFVDRLTPNMMKAFVDPETKLVTTTKIEQDSSILSSINRSDRIDDIVDWPHSGTSSYNSPRGGEDDNFEYTDYNTVVNAYHYIVVDRMAQIYGALGRDEERQQLTEYCNQFRNIFNDSFLDKEKGIYKDGLTASHSSLHSNMFAYCFGLVPDEYKLSVAEFIASRGMACSVYGVQFLLDALYDAGYADYALELMTNQTERGWVNMIEKGATITMEAWDDSFKPNQDWNHAWGAAPANIIPFRLMGIRPTKPGWAEAEIKPQLASLGCASVLVPTIGGGISLDVSQSEEAYKIIANIPPATKCDIFVPVQTSNFTLVVDGDEVSEYDMVDGFLKLRGQFSGNHTFELKPLSTSIEKTPRNKIKGHHRYNLKGQLLSPGNSFGIVIENGRKSINK